MIRNYWSISAPVFIHESYIYSYFLHTIYIIIHTHVYIYNILTHFLYNTHMCVCVYIIYIYVYTVSVNLHITKFFAKHPRPTFFEPGEARRGVAAGQWLVTWSDGRVWCSHQPSAICYIDKNQLVEVEGKSFCGQVGSTNHIPEASNDWQHQPETRKGRMLVVQH